jgi:acyl-coenzyme A thioesterase PaaI-like protein
MGKVVVVNHLTLDGVMQSPGRPDEDTRDRFEHGGWAASRNDEVMGAAVAEPAHLATPGAQHRHNRRSPARDLRAELAVAGGRRPTLAGACSGAPVAP